MKVLATGVFDILHIGHLHFLQEAKKLGDELVVLVSCDDVCTTEKRQPINCQEDRLAVVKALKPVDAALIGKSGDKYQAIIDISPDILALGYDQKFNAKELEEELQKRGLSCKVVQLTNCADRSTTRIICKILDGK